MHSVSISFASKRFDKKEKEDRKIRIYVQVRDLIESFLIGIPELYYRGMSGHPKTSKDSKNKTSAKSQVSEYSFYYSHNIRKQNLLIFNSAFRSQQRLSRKCPVLVMSRCTNKKRKEFNVVCTVN